MLFWISCFYFKGATNGAVVIWNIGRSTKPKYIFQEHERTINRVTFHPSETNYLLSGSQDGLIKLFDIRGSSAAISIFPTNAQSVRDVSFCPHGNGHLFATGLENGQIQLWDVRRYNGLVYFFTCLTNTFFCFNCRPEKPERKITAHSDHIFAIDWHPESR